MNEIRYRNNATNPVTPKLAVNSTNPSPAQQSALLDINIVEYKVSLPLYMIEDQELITH